MPTARNPLQAEDRAHPGRSPHLPAALPDLPSPLAGEHEADALPAALLQRTVGNRALAVAIQRSPVAAAGAPALDSAFEEEMAEQAGNGQPLASDVRSFMQARLGADLGDVRIHQGPAAARLNDRIHAQAFTHGSDVFFGDGKYQPGTRAGTHLLAHELAHTVQQRAAAADAGVVQRKDKDKLPTKTVPLIVVRVTDGKSAPELDPMAFIAEADKVYEAAGIQFGILRYETVDINQIISDTDLVEKSRAPYWNKIKEEKFGGMKGQERQQAEMSFEDKTVQPFVDRWVQAIAAHSVQFDKGIIKCYFVPGHAYADMRGFTIRYKPPDTGKEENPVLKDQGSVVTVNTGFQTPKDLPKKLQHSLGHTLAHELGHALLDEGGHVPSYDKEKGGVTNLMASGSERTHHHMTKGQITKVRASEYARDAAPVAPMMSVADFIKKSGGTRGRNRVLAIDRALENYNRIEGFANVSERLKMLSHLTHLCRDYLALGEKETSSERRKGVRELLSNVDWVQIEILRNRQEKIEYNNTNLHTYAKNGLLAKVKEEIAKKSDVNVQNSVGDTPLTMAIRGGGQDPVKIVDELLKAGADPNKGPFSFYAYDIAKAANRLAMLDLIVKAKGRSAINGATLAPDAVKDASTPEVLSWATLSDNPETQARMRQAYEELYAQDEFKPVMDIARMKVIGPPQADIGAVRIYAISTIDAGWLNAGGTPAGAFQPETRGLIIGSKTSLEDMKGSLIHEMTHMAVSVIFNNDVMPFTPEELDSLKKTGKMDGILKEYMTAIRGDTSSKKRKGAEAEIYRTVIQRVYGGTKEDTGYGNVGEKLGGDAKDMSTAMLQEFVVGIPQAISQFGGKKVEKVTPGLYTFFMETFNKAAREWLKKEKAKPQPSTTPSTGVTPTLTTGPTPDTTVPTPTVPSTPEQDKTEKTTDQPTTGQPTTDQTTTPKPVVEAPKGGNGAQPRPAPAPVFFGDLSDANPFLYFRDNNKGGFNLRVDSRDPGEPWGRVDQFCAYLATYWLATGGAQASLKFENLPKPTQIDAATTVKTWGAKGLDEQVRYARTQIKGSKIDKEIVTKNVANGVYSPGARIWFGTDVHAEAAIVDRNRAYHVYDPNTGAVTIMTKEAFAGYIAKANTFVVTWGT